jgi:hypothetical protein
VYFGARAVLSCQLDVIAYEAAAEAEAQSASELVLYACGHTLQKDKLAAVLVTETAGRLYVAKSAHVKYAPLEVDMDLRRRLSSPEVRLRHDAKEHIYFLVPLKDGRAAAEFTAAKRAAGQRSRSAQQGGPRQLRRRRRRKKRGRLRWQKRGRRRRRQLPQRRKRRKRRPPPKRAASSAELLLWAEASSIRAGYTHMCRSRL